MEETGMEIESDDEINKDDEYEKINDRAKQKRRRRIFRLQLSGFGE